jgi:hypothetical protein
MRYLPILTALLLLLSCADKTPQVNKPKSLTEEQKRKIYTDSFAFTDRDFPDRRDNTASFEAFMNKHYPDLKAKNKYDAFIYALEEPYVDTTKIDTSKHWFRLTVRPVFRKPYCLIVEKQGDKSFLTTKITNGDGGYNTGTLAVQMKFQYRDTLYNNLIKDLERLNFLNMPLHDTTCGPGLDGETWTFELLEAGKYKLLGRWLPERCGDSKTKQLALLGLRIRELSRLDKILTVLGERKSGM